MSKRTRYKQDRRSEAVYVALTPVERARLVAVQEPDESLSSLARGAIMREVEKRERRR